MTRARHEFPAKVKVAAFERAGGCCEGCGVEFRGKTRPEYDHIVADAIGGGNDLGNCRVLCGACHAVKSAKQDIPMIAKTKRVRAKHIGAKPASRRPLPGSKASGWRIKLDGTRERR